MKKLSYGSVVGTFVQVDFMSQVKQLANMLTGARFEALSFRYPPATQGPSIRWKAAYRRGLLSRGAVLKPLRQPEREDPWIQMRLSNMKKAFRLR